MLIGWLSCWWHMHRHGEDREVRRRGRPPSLRRHEWVNLKDKLTVAPHPLIGGTSGGWRLWRKSGCQSSVTHPPTAPNGCLVGCRYPGHPPLSPSNYLGGVYMQLDWQPCPGGVPDQRYGVSSSTVLQDYRELVRKAYHLGVTAGRLQPLGSSSLITSAHRAHRPLAIQGTYMSVHLSSR